MGIKFYLLNARHNMLLNNPDCPAVHYLVAYNWAIEMGAKLSEAQLYALFEIERAADDVD